MNIPDSFKKLFFYRMHPETALRYLPIIDLLRKKGLIDSKILEVGSGSYGIAPYLKRDIVGVDTDFNEPEYSLLKQVKGSAIKLPFKEKEFKVVILSDVLEHLPEKIRAKSIDEAVRVGSKFVIISGPFGIAAAEQDKKMAEYSLKKLGYMHSFFKDHLSNGLPEISELMTALRKNSRVKDVEVVGEYLNLSVREWLMKIFIARNKLQYYFYLKGLMLLVPILRLMNIKPCYRTVILVTLK